MLKLSLRKSGTYSAKSDEEIMENQENSVQQLRSETSQACTSLAAGVEQLRSETSQVCDSIVSGLQENYVSKQDLESYHHEVMKQFESYDKMHKDILASLNSLKNATLYFKREIDDSDC